MLNLTQNNFEQEVINSDKIVVVKYTATWCTPCKALNPIFKELYKEIILRDYIELLKKKK